MRYCALGRTGLELSVLGLGTSPFGGSFGHADESDCRACLNRALNAGINYLDTSPYYGRTRSEAVLGRCLRGIDRDRYFLSTKVGRYGDRPEEFDFLAERVQSSIDESLRRLGIEHIDIVVCHDIEHGSLTQIIDEAIPALREVVRLGKARFIGVSGLPLKVLTEVVSRTEIDAVLSYCHNTLSDTTLLDLLPEFEHRGVGVINASPMGMGRSTDRGPPDWHPAPVELREACSRGPSTADAGERTFPDSRFNSPWRTVRSLRPSWGLPGPRRSPRTCRGSKSRSMRGCSRRSWKYSARSATSPGHPADPRIGIRPYETQRDRPRSPRETPASRNTRARPPSPRLCLGEDSSRGSLGTDIHAFAGKQPFFSYPRILGHELGVEIVDVDAERPRAQGR